MTTLRHTLLLGTALTALAGAADAQQRSREDLLDAVTRHIQICGEISDQQARLGCYDKLQTQVGGVQAPARSPTPLANNPPPAPPPPPSGLPTTGGNQIGAAPLSPPPLMVPGGGAATLGNAPAGPTPLGPPGTDPDRAFNPRDATSAYRPPEGPMARPQPSLQRTGPRPVPNYSSSMPVVTLQASNLTYGASRYWQVTVSVTSNVNRTIDTQVQCSFLNAGRSVGEAYLGPVQLAAGEQVSTDLIGPPTTAFVDSTNCRVMNP
ncbi:MAG: hypothetical protein E6G95_07275 [Alphaproteobacteria bacterium]|nr:MAG: hypothetical protein E6G95_07275 [Alphaproteobacteria bacterium]